MAHFEAIAEASDLPIVAYNIPSRVVVHLEPDTITRLAEIETVRAVKQAYDDLDEARHIVESGLDLYAGDDRLIQPFLELGGVGGICVHTHIVGPQVAEQVQAALGGDIDTVKTLKDQHRAAYSSASLMTTVVVGLIAQLRPHIQAVLVPSARVQTRHIADERRG